MFGQKCEGCLSSAWDVGCWMLSFEHLKFLSKHLEKKFKTGRFAMASHHHELPDDEILLDLLRLIVTRHPSATSVIDEAYQHTPHLATAFLTFNFRETGVNAEHECRCHYDHEYMTYITDTGINFESFSQITKNVIRGRCRHANSNDSPVTPQTPTSYMMPKMMSSDMRNRNTRRYSVDFEMGCGSSCSSNSSNSSWSNSCKRLVQRRSSSNLKSLEMSEHTNNHNRGVSSIISRRSSASLRSLSLEIEESIGETQTSLIHAAAAVGNGALVTFLLKWANVNLLQIGKFQLSPLHLGIAKHKMPYIRNIILRPEIHLVNRPGVFRHAEITKDGRGHTTLAVNKISLVGLCVKTDDYDTLSSLLNSGVLSELALQRGLKEAVDEDSPDAVDLLFKHGARPDLDIIKSAATKSVSVFESVFRRFRKDFKIYAILHPERITRELLMPAILTHNTGVVKLLVQNDVPVTCKGFYQPLTLAVLENQPEVARLLLENQADRSIEMQGCNLLDISACLGYTGVTDVLQKCGFKRKNKSPKMTIPCSLLIGIASKMASAQDVIKLKRQLELKQQSHDEDTVLHVAVKTHLSSHLIGELLKMGSDVNAKNKKHETPLMVAVSKEVCAEYDIIREILFYNPILEQCDKYGKTTLTLAMSRDHAERGNNGNKNSSPSSEDLSNSVATLLLDCGYNVKYDDVRKPHHTVYALRAVWKDLAATIGCGRDGMYVQQNPKTLQTRCREVLRRSQPGIHLHRYLDTMKVPQDIKDFVLMVELLNIHK